MKLGMNIAAISFTFALSLACLAGCATSAEPPTDEETTTPVVDVEDGNLTPSATCPTTATCAMAFSKCPNPRLGGTYCYIAQQCATCRS
jgi:hypothetical protein